MQVEARTKLTYDRGQGRFGEYTSCEQGGRFYLEDCVEQKYRLFTTLQQMVEFAYIQAVSSDRSLLPDTMEDMCKFSGVSYYIGSLGYYNCCCPRNLVRRPCLTQQETQTLIYLTLYGIFSHPHSQCSHLLLSSL